jgi:hypothetical protein
MTSSQARWRAGSADPDRIVEIAKDWRLRILFELN